MPTEASRAEKTYYVDLPAETVGRCWRAFEESLSYPGVAIAVRIEPIVGEERRCRLCLSAADAHAAGREDDLVRDFRLFLDSRGLVELTPRWR